MKNLISLIFIIVFPLTTDWKTLEDTEFKVKYPDNWELNQSGMAGTKFILFAPGSQPAFRDNINLIIQDLKGQNIDLKKFTEISLGQIKQYITNGNVISSETISGPIPKHKLIYSGSQGQLNLKWQQYYWVANEKAYILTFTADQSTFAKQTATVNLIMDSFIVK